MRVLPIIFFLVPLLTLAGNEGGPNCGVHDGLDVCDSTFESSGQQLDYTEQRNDTFEIETQKHQSPFDASLTDDEINQIQREDAFKNIDSFRAYMKTIEDPVHAGNDSEFSVNRRILDSADFDLDCRIVADSIYELPNSQYYDCVLQRFF